MILRDYIEGRDIGFGAFADRIGVSRQTLYLYIEGKRMPRPSILRRIHDETEGEVTANDFVAAIAPASTPPEQREAV